MAVLSVDGLDVISGKPAEDTKKGYIVDGYSQVEIKGYRISDSDSASFVFTTKNSSYVGKIKGDTRNSGVIGVRVFKEKVKPAPVIINNPVPYFVPVPHYVPTPVVYPWNPYYIYNTCGLTVNTGGCGGLTINGNNGLSVTGTGTLDNINLTCNNNAVHTFHNSGGGDVSYGAGGGMAYMASSCGAGAGDPGYSSAAGSGGGSAGAASGGACNASNVLRSRGVKAASLKNSFDDPISYKQFDTGTTWGKKQEDKIKREYFEKGEILTELVIYYASRQALVSMGIDLDNDPKISDDNNRMPRAFNGGYCQAPQGWQG